MARITVALCEIKPQSTGHKMVIVRTRDGVQMTYYFDTVEQAYQQAQRDYQAGMMDKKETK